MRSHERVYNLSVGGAHTYYVGGEPVLVHNMGCGRLTVDPHGAFSESERRIPPNN